jgi:lipid-binding SYLF domain-containing protein
MKAIALSLLGLLAFAGGEEDRRLEESALVFEEIMSIADRSIPQELLERAQCAVIVPGLKKGGFIVGAKYGRGFASCRMPGGKGWTGPVGMRIEGGSVGLQFGGAESDVILLVMNKRGMDRLLSSKFTLGGEATVAAGPVGRDTQAQTDATMRAEILSWSRSRGVFAGIALQGATLRGEDGTDRALYGREVSRRDVLEGKIPAPKSASRLLQLFNKHSSRKGA